MNCRRVMDNFPVSDHGQSKIRRIGHIFTSCRRPCSGEGDWLFGQYCVADTMFTTMVMQFNSYNIELDREAMVYMEIVSQQPPGINWIEASTQSVLKRWR